jgi:L-Ala-D/L-Glu epimerase
MDKLTVSIEHFPIAGAFTIARGSRTEAIVVRATIQHGNKIGQGECVPYARYGETVIGVLDQINAQKELIGRGATHEELAAALPPGAARNALDCALWDLDTKRAELRIWDYMGLPEPKPVTTCYTISLGTPEIMMEAAKAASTRPLLKVKLGGDGDVERIRAVRAGAPDARLVVDANESWRSHNFMFNLVACKEVGVELIEQPLPADDDAPLEMINRIIPICADESLHDRASLDKLKGRYDAVNIKLDKTGGLTEALALAQDAKQRGYKIMVGCMVGTSLAMAPATMLTGLADFVDLDGPLLLAKDRPNGLSFVGNLVHPPMASLWG